MNKAKKTTGS